MLFRLILLLTMGICGTSLADEAANAGAKLYQYFEAFNAQDTHRVANEVYWTPVHIGGGEAHRVLETPQAAVDNLDNLYEVIKDRGWKESRISDLKICVLSETLALVDTQYSRLNAEGDPIPPALRTVLYVVQKLDGDWRIVAFYSHDNDKRPVCG